MVVRVFWNIQGLDQETKQKVYQDIGALADLTADTFNPDEHVGIAQSVIQTLDPLLKTPKPFMIRESGIWPGNYALTTYTIGKNLGDDRSSNNKRDSDVEAVGEYVLRKERFLWKSYMSIYQKGTSSIVDLNYWSKSKSLTHVVRQEIVPYSVSFGYGTPAREKLMTFTYLRRKSQTLWRSPQQLLIN